MNKALLAMGDTTRLAQGFLHGLNGRHLFFSYGNVVPDLSSFETSYWMGGAYACKLRNIGLATNLCSPGSAWLPSLDIELTARKVYEGTLADLSDTKREIWVKPSEAKISTIPAGVYSFDKLSKLFEAGKFSPEISLQWTHEVMSINYEHRFFVAEGEICTGSAYLVNKVGYHHGIDQSRMAEAKAFAEYVITSDPSNMPFSFTLDVGLNLKTGKWFVIEANRAWSSGLYGCDPAAALEVIDSSCAAGFEEKWQWRPDAHLIELSKSWPPLEVHDINANSLEFVTFEDFSSSHS